MSQNVQAADWLSAVSFNTETLPGFNMKVDSAPPHSLLQSAYLLHEAAPPLPGPSAWLAESSCQSLTRADIIPPFVATPLSCPLSAGSNGYYGNDYDPPSFASCDWLLPRCLTKGRSYGPEHLQCVCCGTSSAPLWRKDAAGRPQCNSCSSQNREDTPLLKPKRRTVVAQRKFARCVNCETETTTLWRRNSAGQPLCNACGLYYKLHQMDRPLSLKKDGIQTRNRRVTRRKHTGKKTSQSQSKVFRLATPTESCLSACFF
ncbi:erythroid transcription factor-like [Salarias fasciatus]|uniref:erythroid transcription factor-like n=1 Tax=Salarias fasciatus TaxID=181472 RepID=UPI0011765FD5|nr:erythroid transcription factor [Salarias fasciatus]